MGLTQIKFLTYLIGVVFSNCTPKFWIDCHSNCDPFVIAFFLFSNNHFG